MLITIGTVNLSITGADSAPTRPLLQIENAEFIRGYQAGMLAASHGESAGIPLTDADIVESLQELHAEEIKTRYFVVGSLFGRAMGRWP